MNPEDICELPMLRAEHRRIEHKNQPASDFRVRADAVG